ncbi:ribosome biogenesis GTPase YlqF [Bacillus carboniphilus]
MAKARRQVTEKLKLVDIVFELVDARIPMSSRNPLIDEIINQKPKLILLNKADMADGNVTSQWINYFEERNITALAINSQKGDNINLISKEAKSLLTKKLERLQAKGVKPRAIRAMIVGVPNVGKSTLINKLAKKNIAQTGDRPGITKAQSWIKVGREMELLDTPGILWPKFEDQEVGYKLAITGAIKDEILNIQDVAVYALRYFMKNHPDRLKERFHLTDLSEEIVDIFDEIGKNRGYLLSGGVVNYDKVSEAILREIRSGKLGRLTLDYTSFENK